MTCRDCGEPTNRGPNALYCANCLRLRRNAINRSYLSRNPGKRREWAQQSYARADVTKLNADARARRHAHRLAIRDVALRNRHSITREQFNAMLEEQDWRCAVCRRDLPRTAQEQYDRREPQVDHDHQCCAGSITCGRCIRGLLCRTCNTRLGIVENASPDWWAAALAYVADRASPAAITVLVTRAERK